jgi:hypothetical protein
MTFKRTTPITALDLDPFDLPDAGRASLGAVSALQASMGSVLTQSSCTSAT